MGRGCRGRRRLPAVAALTAAAARLLVGAAGRLVAVGDDELDVEEEARRDLVADDHVRDGRLQRRVVREPNLTLDCIYIKKFMQGNTG